MESICPICRYEEYDGEKHNACYIARENDYAQALAWDNWYTEISHTPRRIEGKDSRLLVWEYPRGIKDRVIREMLAAKGYASGGWDCRCGDGDCCGYSFSNGLDIQQNRNAKRAYLRSWRCC